MKTALTISVILNIGFALFIAWIFWQMFKVFDNSDREMDEEMKKQYEINRNREREKEENYGAF